MCAGDNMNGDSLAFCPEAIKSTLGRGAKSLKFMQLYRLKQKHAMNGATTNTTTTTERPNTPEKPTKDWLAMSTEMGHRAMELARDGYERAKRAGLLRNLPTARTASHALMALSVFAICCMVAHKVGASSDLGKNKMWTVLYVATFGMHFGAQVWMTMVSGLVLYFSLPRHVFGNVQEHLFPAYYTFASVVSFVMIVAYTQAQSEVRFVSKEFVQISVMTLTFIIELFIRLYVAQTVVMLKHTKTRMEAVAGSGQEVGKHILGELANCPHYMNILRRFRRLHSYTAIGTLITVSCSIYHINYLADKMCM